MATIPQDPNTGHYQLANNATYTLNLIDHDANGAVVPMPAGDAENAAASGQFAASLGVTVDTTVTPPTLTLAALVVESDPNNGGGGIGITLTDSQGLTEDSATMGLLFDIVVPAPGPAASMGIDLTAVTVGSQPTPTNPGP